MRDALTTLPWVEPDTIKTDGKLKQVRFAVKDRAAFDFEQLTKALGNRYGKGAKLLAGPTTQ